MLTVSRALWGPRNFQECVEDQHRVGWYGRRQWQWRLAGPRARSSYARLIPGVITNPGPRGWDQAPGSRLPVAGLLSPSRPSTTSRGAALSAELPERPTVAGGQASRRTNVAPPCCCWRAPKPPSLAQASGSRGCRTSSHAPGLPRLPSSELPPQDGSGRGFHCKVCCQTCWSSPDLSPVPYLVHLVMFSWLVLMLVDVLQCLDIKILGMQHHMRGRVATATSGHNEYYQATTNVPRRSKAS
nr:uncharacterized protein LOC129054304 [Pongo abelii]